MSYSIDGISLQLVSRVRNTLVSNVDQQALPASESKDAFLTDFEGVSRGLMIEGYYKASLADMKTWVAQMEALQDGAQEDVALVLTMRDTALRVTVNNFVQDWEIPGLGKVSYTLELLEGQT